MDHPSELESRQPVDTSNAPLYITIGPQCCGKTTVLKNIHPDLVDVCLDDQPDVYVSVSTDQFLSVAATGRLIEEGVQSKPGLTNKQSRTKYHGRTLLERMQSDYPEVALVLQRWNGNLSSEIFATQISTMYPGNGKTSQLLISAVEEFLSSTEMTPPNKLQLFVLESLFRPHPKTRQSAIQRGHSLLRNTPPHVPVAWGNTNSRPRDYQTALEVAFETQRPVYFVVCHPLHEPVSSTTGSTKQGETSHNVGRLLPWVPLDDLFRRNLERFAATGKYVPAGVIVDFYLRVKDFLLEGMEGEHQLAGGGGTDRGADVNLWAIEQNLVDAASPNDSPAIRYRLTDRRLIEKVTYP